MTHKEIAQFDNRGIFAITEITNNFEFGLRLPVTYHQYLTALKKIGNIEAES